MVLIPVGKKQSETDVDEKAEKWENNDSSLYQWYLLSLCITLWVLRRRVSACSEMLES